jgi:hypothetical protein
MKTKPLRLAALLHEIDARTIFHEEKRAASHATPSRFELRRAPVLVQAGARRFLSHRRLGTGPWPVLIRKQRLNYLPVKLRQFVPGHEQAPLWSLNHIPTKNGILYEYAA